MIEQLPDGIYFGLPFDTYHGQQRLSASGCCNMLIDPATFWADSWLNPDRKDGPTEARVAGSAYHCGMLEPDRFATTYRPKLDQGDYPGALTTATAIGDALAELGLPKTKAGELVLDKAKRLRDAGYTGEVWHLMLDEWERSILPYQVAIPQALYNDVVRDMKRLRDNPELAPFVSGGQAEVSMLWTDKDGTRWKVRFDYLRADGVVDLKSFANPNGKNLDRCIADAIAYNRYYVQAVLYWQACEKIREFGDALPIFGAETAAQEDLIEAIRESVEPFEFWWIFQQKGGMPNVLARKLRRNAVVHNDRVADAPDADKRESLRKKLSRPPSRIFEKGALEIQSCARLFKQCSEIWPSGAWGVMMPVSEIDDEAFSSFFLES